MKYKITETHIYVLDSHNAIHDVLCFPRSNRTYEDLSELVEDCLTFELTNPEHFKSFDHMKVTSPSKGGNFYTQDFLNPILKLVNENRL
ncbi:hypothetical protein [Paenibacillus massiliensis]|uniref:hypothetical protein n=1 Tax=Paenibacillus massiliensis TaxID=225917 RepID=UPI0004708498|nr:hypothetical protein [Paenibacillus massiliensis]